MFGEPCAELMDNNNNQSKVEKTAVGAEQMVLFCLCVFFLLPPRVKLDYFCLGQGETGASWLIRQESSAN